MNTSALTPGSRAFFGILGASFLAASPTTSLGAPDNGSPRGTLTIDKNVVLVGGCAKLSWTTIYPSNVHDMVELKSPGQAVPKQPLNMKVRVLGSSFQSGANQLPVNASFSLNNSPWTQFFYGREDDVNPEEVVINMHAQQGDTIEFGACGWNTDWLPFHSTRTEDTHVKVLSNGNAAPVPDKSNIKDFLKPYVDASGKVRIGPRDILIFWECSNASPGEPQFDMQDFVLLVTFE